MQLLKCEHCGAPLAGMTDSTLFGPSKQVVCRDREPCQARVKDNRALALKIMHEALDKP